MRKTPQKSILQLYKNKKTVFTINDIAILWREKNRNNLRVRIKYFVDKGDLTRLRRGIYAKENYSKLEVAVKIYTPSYISCETVLRNEGVIFQHQDTIFAMSYLSREIQLDDGLKIQYRSIKNEMLLNDIGLQYKNCCSVATKERAVVDMLYLFGDMQFDNLNKIDWALCMKIAKAYNIKALIKNVSNYKKEYAIT